MEVDLSASAAATAAAAHAQAHTAAAAAHAAAHAAANPDMEGYHPEVECDKTGQCPIVGTRYHLKGHNWDLCAAEYAKLSEAEKAQFEAIEPPAYRLKSGAADGSKAEAVQKGFHPGVTRQDRPVPHLRLALQPDGQELRPLRGRVQQAARLGEAALPAHRAAGAVLVGP